MLSWATLTVGAASGEVELTEGDLATRPYVAQRSSEVVDREATQALRDAAAERIDGVTSRNESIEQQVSDDLSDLFAVVKRGTLATEPEWAGDTLPASHQHHYHRPPPETTTTTVPPPTTTTEAPTTTTTAAPPTAGPASPARRAGGGRRRARHGDRSPDRRNHIHHSCRHDDHLGGDNHYHHPASPGDCHPVGPRFPGLRCRLLHHRIRRLSGGGGGTCHSAGAGSHRGGI